MALSPNYGWAEPDNSSLVKNGAQDIRALGDAIDTSLWNVGFGQAGKNKIINGDMNIWQRGTSFASAANGSYSADRFKYAFDGSGTATISQQAFTAGAAPVAGYESQYFLRHLVTSAGSTTFTQIFQPIEDVRTFAGQTVTFSFWAKADSARSSFIYAEQNFGSGGSATVQYLSMGSASLTTSWQRFSFTVALSSISGKTIGTNSQLNFYIRCGTALNASTDIWGVQLEYGSKATPFETATGTFGGELALCQRYYYRVPGEFETTVAPSGSSICVLIPLPVTMRIVPSASTNVSNASYSTSPSTNQWGLVQAQISWSTKSGTVTVTLVSTQTTGTLQLGAATFSPVPNSIKIVPDRILEFSAEL